MIVDRGLLYSTGVESSTSPDRDNEREGSEDCRGLLYSTNAVPGLVSLACLMNK